MAASKRGRQPPSCSVEGCDGAVFGRGLCRNCWQKASVGDTSRMLADPMQLWGADRPWGHQRHATG